MLDLVGHDLRTSEFNLIRGIKMIIRTYEDALLAVALKLPHSEIEFEDVDLTIKPTRHLKAPVSASRVEGAILDRQAHIHFE